MEIIEKHYYQEAMQQIEKEESDPQYVEELVELLQQYKKHMEGYSITINKDKVAWFEELKGATLEFAKVCKLDIKVWTDNSYYGNIQFETSYFELSSLEPPYIHKFWNYLCSSATQFSITNCPQIVRIDFKFALYDKTQAKI